MTYVCVCCGVNRGAHVYHRVDVLHVSARGGAHAHGGGGGRRGLAARHAALSRAIPTLSLSEQLARVFYNYNLSHHTPANQLKASV